VPITTTTSVRIEVALLLKARAKGINPSRVLNQALRSLVGDEPDLTAEKIAELEKGRSDRILSELEEQEIRAVKGVGEALSDLQVAWNLYLSHGEKPRTAKLEWIKARASRYPALASMKPEKVLTELEG
jgi:hypothetical protein